MSLSLNSVFTFFYFFLSYYFYIAYFIYPDVQIASILSKKTLYFEKDYQILAYLKPIKKHKKPL